MDKLSARLMSIRDKIMTANVMWIESEKLKQKLEANERIEKMIEALNKEIDIAITKELEDDV